MMDCNPKPLLIMVFVYHIGNPNSDGGGEVVIDFCHFGKWVDDSKRTLYMTYAPRPPGST